MATMTYDIEALTTWYFFREPIYWFSSHFLYKWFHNEIFVFIFIDCIVLFFLVYVCAKVNIKPYFILVFILFFSNLMGFLNVYRQFIASVFLILGFLYLSKGFIKSKIFYLVSILTHNVSGVFLPIIFLKNKLLQGWIFWLSTIISMFLMVILASSKSIGETGETSPILFIIVSVVIFFSFILLNKFKVTTNNAYLYYVNLYGLLVSSISALLLSSIASKRISMIALIFMLYSIYWSIENLDDNYKIINRVFFVILAILPTIVFPSAFNMLLVNNVQ